MRAIAMRVPPSPFGGETREVRCACGATRQAPVALAVVSCVQCGAAMGQAAEVMARGMAPSRALLALATFLSQLMGTIAFALALVWIISLGVRDAVVVSVLAGGAACVFACGAAYRGNVIALAVCAAIDVAIAIALFTEVSQVIAFVPPPLANVDATQFQIGRIVVGGIAAIAAVECLVAFPQAREFAAWLRRRRLEPAALR